MERTENTEKTKETEITKTNEETTKKEEKQAEIKIKEKRKEAKEEKKEEIKATEILNEVEKKIEQQQSEEKQEKIIEQAREKEHKERSKKYSIKDAASVNATVGFGDNYISAYAVAMNASAYHIGLLTSIPNLFAPLAQLFTSKYMQKHSRKSIFSIPILIQSLVWLPIIFVSFLFLRNIIYAPLLLVIFYTIYALFGNFAAPAWISWMGELVEARESGKFFGMRNKIGGIVALISMILGGIILDLFKKQATLTSKIYFVFIGFGIIFFLAMCFRLLSRHYVLKQYEPHFRFQKESYFSFFQFVKKAPTNNYGRFAIYIALIILAANIIGPYYTLYLLRDLGFSYIQFMLFSVSATVASFIFMTKWGNFADRFGNIKMLKISSFFIPIICFMFPIAAYISMPYKLYFLLFANFIAGFSWAGFNLAAGNFVFEAATAQRRGLCSAYSAIMNGLGVVIGATIGSFLISHLKISFMNVIMFVSLISGFLRYIVSFVMLRKIKEVRKVEEKADWRLIPLASEVYNLHSYLKRGLQVKIVGKNKEK